MSGLVELYKGKEPMVKTLDLWERFGYKEHRVLKLVITKNMAEFAERGEIISATTVAGIRRVGQPDKSYLLNERQFNLLVMLVKNTPESVVFKSQLERDFHRTRTALAKMLSMRKTEDWQDTRESGKEIYHQKSDIIKQFVDYATAQGSKNAIRYYSNLANMENSALFFLEQKFPNVREFLNIRQLMQVSFADHVIDKALIDGMDKKLDYHAIFDLAKERVVIISNAVGKSQVISLHEQEGLMIPTKLETKT
jgi:hypothetical protein